MEVTKIKAGLGSMSDIQFDRFIDHSSEARPPEQKLYLGENNTLVLPSTNIIEGFLFGKKPAGCATSFEKPKSGQYIAVGLSHIAIKPSLIPFLDDKGKPIRFTKFDGKRFRISMDAARTQKGSMSIKQEAQPRPVLCLPWALSFEIMIVKNPLVDEAKLYNWFVQGGMQIALGNHRPVYGRFSVEEWEVK